MLIVALKEDWTTYFTAVGTVATALAAVGIAWWGDKRTGKRVRDEWARTQFAEAAQVQVLMGSRDAPGTGDPDPVYEEPTTSPRKHMAAVVTNNSAFAVTNVDARFVIDNEVVRAATLHPLPGGSPLQLPGGYFWSPPSDPNTGVILAPWAPGMMFESRDMAPEQLAGASVITRWTDRSGQCWQYERGQPIRITTDRPWTRLFS
jgi:hypothetical protein